MKLDKKKLMIIGGVLLAVGVGVYFWRKRKSESDALDDLDEDSLIDEEAEVEELKKSTTATGEIINAKRPLLINLKDKKGVSKSKEPIKCPNTAVAMGYLQRQSQNPLLTVHIAGEDRPKASKLNYKRGDKISIMGTSFDGNYKISKLWRDANGNIGAVYIFLPPRKYKSTETPDRTFENRACIQKFGITKI